MEKYVDNMKRYTKKYVDHMKKYEEIRNMEMIPSSLLNFGSLSKLGLEKISTNFRRCPWHLK